MKIEKLSKVIQVLEDRAGEEHLLETWLKLINANFNRAQKIQNTRSLAKTFYQIQRLGGRITKRSTLLGTGRESVRAYFYKYK